jgi:tetratricopeptide (TPR) repeat protein
MNVRSLSAMKTPPSPTLLLHLQKFLALALAALALLSAASPARAYAEALFQLPDASPRATVSQRLGLTDITIRYHRPLVGGRKIWGELVPYNQVWRAGANENTTIEFSDPVTVEGQKLGKGIYGLHMLPTPDSWTIIFSKNSGSWGSYNYDQKEDALRVTVKPQPAEQEEALAYTFEELKPDSVLVKMRWEKLAVPFRVVINHEEQVIPHLREQLRGLAQWYWSPWNDAANYCLEHKFNLEEALRWADHSVSIEERFENLDTKANLLVALNRPDEAKTARDRVLAVGNAQQIYFHARGLQAKDQPAEAMELFRTVVKRFPQHWAGHMAQARLQSAAGDFANAAKEVKAALELVPMAPEAQKQALQGLIDKLGKNQDINK